MSTKIQTIPGEELWGERKFEVDALYASRLGSIRIWCKMTADEFWLGHLYDSPNTVDFESVDELPDDLVWSRWALKPTFQTILFSPIFPDRSVVAKPESPFRLTPGVQTKIYVRVPIWIQIYLAGKEPILIEELPTVVLSNTWFGGFTDGELCYWISTNAFRHVEPDPDRLNSAVCPIRITNKSEDELLVEKLRLPVEGLSLYLQEGQLWANETTVSFRGQKEESQIDVVRKPPKEAENAKLAAQSRTPVKRGLRAKTFESLKNLPGLGFLPS